MAWKSRSQWHRMPRQWRREDQKPAEETLAVRWRIHVEAMKAIGREPKSFDEWLNS
jgi:hypothetical protein